MTLLLRRKHKDTYVTEIRALYDIIIIFVVVFILNIPINIFGLLQYRPGRFIYTCDIAFVHFFFHFRLIGYRLIKAVTDDQDYRAMVLKSTEIDDLDITSIKSLDLTTDHIAGMLSYLIENSGSITFITAAKMNMNDKILTKTFAQYSAANYANAYLELNNIIILFHNKDIDAIPGTTKNTFYNFVNIHIIENASQQVYLIDPALDVEIKNLCSKQKYPTLDLVQRVKNDISDTIDILWTKLYLKEYELTLSKNKKTIKEIQNHEH
jgi:hypothetical protein